MTTAAETQTPPTPTPGEILATSLRVNEPPEALALPAVGARVRCEGLTRAAELNGCLGRVVSHEGERARVLLDGGRSVGVKPGNLIVVFELLDRLLEVPGIFAREVLARLDPTDCALLAQAGRLMYRHTGTSDYNAMSKDKKVL